MENAGFIGFGLIGGSIAKGLRKKYSELRIMAYATNLSSVEMAQEDGIVNLALDSAVSPRLSECDIIFLCAPAEENIRYLSRIAPLLKEGAVLTDVSSTKEKIAEEARRLHLGNCFIGGHPMAGSEQCGYSASTDYLFSNAYYLITPIEEGQERLITVLRDVAEALQAIPMLSTPENHDRAVAAVSHLPHLIASSLVNLVEDNDDSDKTMRMIAAGGFRDITRIASSSPEMWEQICETNADFLSEILDKYIAELQGISRSLKKEKGDRSIFHMFEKSCAYRSTIDVKNRGALAPDYSFSVDIEDEVGAISTISVILASKGISIKNIGINNARDHGEGALRISFYEEEAREKALSVLRKYRYDLRD